MTIPAIDQLSTSQTGKEATINRNFNALRAEFVLTYHESASSALTLVLYGGRFNGLDLADQTLTLTASATCYVEASSTTGVASFNTTGAYTAGKVPLGIAITSSTGLLTFVQEPRTATAAAGGASLSAVNVWTKNQSVAAVALTDGSSIATDASLSNNFKVTLGGNRTLANPTNLTEGMWLHWVITQDGTGSRTLAYGSAFKWPNAATPTLSTVAGSIDTISAYYDGTRLLSNINKAFG